MMNLRAVLGTSACVCLISACAYWPSYPSLDRSPNVDFTSITRQTGWKHCKVSVVLTKAEVLKAAKYYGNPHPKKETGWGSLVAAISPGDQLRQVSCFETGSSGNTAGDIFYGLFRGGKLVAQMHTIIIN